MGHTLGFPKSNRLKSRKALALLFKSGYQVRTANLRLLYIVSGNSWGIKCGVGLSGRYFKKAVERNRIKRLLREAYRLQQDAIADHYKNVQKELSIFILYTGKDMPTYNSIYESVGVVLQKLIAEVNAANT